MKDLYRPIVLVEGPPIEHIPQDWERGLDKYGFLELIKLLYFGKPTKENACVRLLFAFFHGGYLWLDEPITIMVELILAITRIPKDGIDPSQYI